MKVDKVDRVALAPVHTGNKVERTFDIRATESIVDFVADLSPVSATIDFVSSVYRT